VVDSIAWPLTVPQTSDGSNFGGGAGIELQNGGSLVARDVLLERVTGDGIAIYAGCSADLERLVVRDGQFSVPAPNELETTGGDGIRIQGGGFSSTTASLRDVLVEGNRYYGVRVEGAGTVVEFDDLTITDTGPTQRGRAGWGLVVHDSAQVTIRGFVSERNTTVGAVAFADGVLEIDDAVVRDIRPDVTTGTGIGLGASVGGTLIVDGADVSGCAGAGLAAFEDGLLRATDATVTGSGMANAVVLGADLELIGGSLTSPTRSPSFGGQVGVFAWDFLRPSRLLVDGTAIGEAAGPAIYLRGEGQHEIRGADLFDSGDPAGAPGGVLAIDGSGAWDPVEQTGLLVVDTTMRSLNGDAILLHGTGATIDGNTFLDVAGDALRVQGCDPAAPPDVEILDQAEADSDSRAGRTPSLRRCSGTAPGPSWPPSPSRPASP